MFNLPWYSWIHVLILPVLMVMIWAEYAMAGFPKWTRRLVTLQILACIASIFLFWNATLFSSLFPLDYLVFALVASLCLYNAVNLTYELACAAKLKRGDREFGSMEESLTTSSSCVKNLDFDADELELGGDYDEAATNAVAENIPLLFDKSASGGDKIRASFGMLGVAIDGDEARQEDSYSTTIIFYALFLVPVLGAPLWMSMKLVGLI